MIKLFTLIRKLIEHFTLSKWEYRFRCIMRETTEKDVYPTFNSRLQIYGTVIDESEVVYRCMCWVANNIKYKSETPKDYWQSPKGTLYRKTGDCEDQAILLIALLKYAHVNISSVRFVIGQVVDGDGKVSWHGYTIYKVLDRWVTLDTTFSFEDLPVAWKQDYLKIGCYKKPEQVMKVV